MNEQEPWSSFVLLFVITAVLSGVEFYLLLWWHFA